MKQVRFLLFLAMTTLTAHAQRTKTPVAVFPFVPALPEYKARAIQIQGIVMETISSSPKIELIDRSSDSMLMTELTSQMREESVSAEGLVEQGKVKGAKAMIVGKVSNVTIEEKHPSSGFSLTKSNNNNAAVLYSATVSFTLLFSSIETGVTPATKTFSNKGSLIETLKHAHIELAATPEGAVLQAVKACQKQVLDWLDEALSPGIRILRIDQHDAAGIPTTALVTGIASSVRNNARIIVNLITLEDDGTGKKIRREQRLAELRVAEKQGDITVCRISEGQQALEEKIKNGATLECTVH